MIIIDLSHLFFRNFWMNKKEIIEYRPDDRGISRPTGEINEGYMMHVIFASILKLTGKFQASEKNRVVIACDARPSWRHEYYLEHSKEFIEYKNQTYKGNRSKDPTLPWDKIFGCLNIATKMLDELTDFIVLEVPLLEADDVIAILARYAGETEDVFVCSSDKDFHQLQTEKIHIYDPMKKIIIPPIDVERHKQLHYIVAGDDNIKGIKSRVGKKTAEKLINSGLDTILKTNPDMMARYKFNEHLMDFDCIPEDLCENCKIMFDKNKEYSYNGIELMRFFAGYRMQKMAGRLTEFKFKGKVRESYKAPKPKVREEIVETSIAEFFS